MKVLITQSNYIPWKGFIDSIALVDKVVLYDNMQYTKRDWRNRNLIKTPQGLKWLSIPVEVKGKFDQKINETKISDNKWNINHLNILKQNYKKSKCYKEVIEWVETLYLSCNYEYLSDINFFFLKEILFFLDIKTSIMNSSLFDVVGDKTEKLVNICVDLNATEYYTGPAAKNYLDENCFYDKNIKVNYLDYSGYKEYTQLYNDFEHCVSVLDLIFNCGADSKKYLKNKL
jgi:hypothetical protein